MALDGQGPRLETCRKCGAFVALTAGRDRFICPHCRARYDLVPPQADAADIAISCPHCGARIWRSRRWNMVPGATIGAMCRCGRWVEGPGERFDPLADQALGLYLRLATLNRCGARHLAVAAHALARYRRRLGRSA